MLFFKIYHGPATQKLTLPYAIAFILLQTSKFCSSCIIKCVLMILYNRAVIRRHCSSDNRGFLCVNRSLNKWLITFYHHNNTDTLNILYTSLNWIMPKGLRSSVGSASDLQSRGPGFDPGTGHTCCMIYTKQRPLMIMIMI